MDVERFRLRRFVERLVALGECEVHDAPIDLVDVAAVLDGNPRATWFKAVGPGRAELVGNVMGSRRRLALSLDTDVAVDDVGRVLNPFLVDGQTHGSTVQGLGQALSEDCVYDPSGQLLSGSFMDYAMPRAHMFPDFVTENNEVPAPNNPLGIKGAGEGGSTGAPPAIINAIVDALREFGVRDVPMPATSHRIWQAIQKGRAS